jgi:hypothetical protein
VTQTVGAGHRPQPAQRRVGRRSSPAGSLRPRRRTSARPARPAAAGAGELARPAVHSGRSAAPIGHRPLGHLARGQPGQSRSGSARLSHPQVRVRRVVRATIAMSRPAQSASSPSAGCRRGVSQPDQRPQLACLPDGRAGGEQLPPRPPARSRAAPPRCRRAQADSSSADPAHGLTTPAVSPTAGAGRPASPPAFSR